MAISSDVSLMLPPAFWEFTYTGTPTKPKIRKTAEMTTPMKMALPAARLAFARSPWPRDLDSRALAPTPVPTATATIRSWMGKARPRAVRASSPPSRMLAR